MASVPFVDRY